MSVEIAIEKINKKYLEKSDSVDLSCLGLKEVPQQLKKISWLKRLNISSNNLSDIPLWFNEFHEIEIIDARNNVIRNLQKGLRLDKLKSLNLRNNAVEVVTEEFRELIGLTHLILANNSVEKLPAWLFEIPHLNIENNPIIDPPVEVYSRGLDAVRNYFKESSRGTEKLFEAKVLIVGEPGGGKTTLMNKILDPSYTLTFYEFSTKGIDIKPYYFIGEDNINFRINLWDFGGQEIYHATHQFFLTKRSLYILLSDNRAEDTNFNYWLQTIELLSGNSPLIIIQNEKQSRKVDINETGMKERFKNIKRTFSFNLAVDKIQLKSLLKEIQHQVSYLPHIGAELPKIWVVIRKALEEKSKTLPYISEATYLDICQKFGMVEKERANFLSDYFHDLGVFLHFKDNAVLKRWIILKPDWGTEAVYKVLDNKKVISNNGYFTKDDLRDIWNESKYADMHDELITLMMKFELCYELEDYSSYIAAQLLQRVKPLYNWNNANNLILKYEYEFMPKGIITRFIVRMHYYISNQKHVWREGVVLERAGTYAEVIETYGRREIRIRVHGVDKKEFLAIIIDTFDKIHLSYTGLKASKLIPCNCTDCQKNEKPYYFEYFSLKKFLSKGVKTDRCKESAQEIIISSLIDDFFGNAYKGTKAGLEIFISYNVHDKTHKDELLKHLRVLSGKYNYVIYDRSDVSTGENEKAYIRSKLDSAIVILCLLSPDYLDDEWNMNNELSKAVDRSETKTCLFIPIIIRDCIWDNSVIGNVKPLMYQSLPLFTEGVNHDKALTDATIQIKESISSYLDKRFEEADI